ncbi:hypothetical protein CJU89_0925 [Yarrowia sp. B02]|nr:hypothetical protein CJU89_0925 [Yarrowia sp. B02]
MHSPQLGLGGSPQLGSPLPPLDEQSEPPSATPVVPLMAPKRRESLRRRSSVKNGLGIETGPLTPRRPSDRSLYTTPEPEEPLARTDSYSSISEEIMTVSPVSPVLQTPPLSFTPRSLSRANSVSGSLSSREGSVDPLTPIVPPRGGLRRHSSLKDFDKTSPSFSETSPLSFNRQTLRRSASALAPDYFSPRESSAATSPGTPLNYSQEMMSKRAPSQRYDSLIPADPDESWSPLKTQPEVSISSAPNRPNLAVSSASSRSSQVPGPPMSSVWLDDNSDDEKPESRWKGLRRSSKASSIVTASSSTVNVASHGISHSASFPLLPLRESGSSSSSNYNDKQSDKSIGADTEHSSVSSRKASASTPKQTPKQSPKPAFTPKQTPKSPSKLKSPLRRSDSGSKWNLFRSPRHKKSSSVSSNDLSATISRPYGFTHVKHMDSPEAMVAPVGVPDSPVLLQRNKSTSSAHNALKNGLRNVKDRALGHSPSKSLSGESFDNSFGGPISKTPSNATNYSVHTTHSRTMLAEPGVTLNTSKPVRPKRPDDLVLPRVHDDEPRRLSNSSSNYSGNSTVGSKSQVGVTASTTPSMSPDGRDRFSSVQSEHAARVANLLKDSANSPNPNLSAFPAPNLSVHRHSWRFSDAELDIEEEEGEEEGDKSPSASPRIPQRSERRRGSSYDIQPSPRLGYEVQPRLDVQPSPRLGYEVQPSPRLGYEVHPSPRLDVPSPRLSQQFETSLHAPQTPSARRKNHGLGLIKNQPSSDSIGSSWTSPGSDFVEQHNWLCQSETESAASTPNASQTTFRRSALLPSPLLPQQQQQPYVANGRHLSTSSLPSHGAILEDLAEEARPSVQYEQTQTWF